MCVYEHVSLRIYILKGSYILNLFAEHSFYSCFKYMHTNIMYIGGQDQEPVGDDEVLGRVAYSGRVRQVVRPAPEALHWGAGG